MQNIYRPYRVSGVYKVSKTSYYILVTYLFLFPDPNTDSMVKKNKNFEGNYSNFKYILMNSICMNSNLTKKNLKKVFNSFKSAC